jgi:hypothetical protein
MRRLSDNDHSSFLLLAYPKAWKWLWYLSEATRDLECQKPYVALIMLYLRSNTPSLILSESYPLYQPKSGPTSSNLPLGVLLRKMQFTAHHLHNLLHRVSWFFAFFWPLRSPSCFFADIFSAPASIIFIGLYSTDLQTLGSFTPAWNMSFKVWCLWCLQSLRHMTWQSWRETFIIEKVVQFRNGGAHTKTQRIFIIIKIAT